MAQPPDATVPLKSALHFYFAQLLVIIGGGIAAKVLDDPHSAPTAVRIDLITTAVFSLVILVGSIRARRSLAGPLSTLGAARWYLVAPGLALLTVGLSVLVCKGLTRLIGLPELRYSEDFLAAGYPWAVLVLTIAVQPAIFEELAFRGVIGSAMQRVVGPREAILVTALLFATIHLSPASFPHLFVCGLALGYVRHRSGSLYPGMLLHFSHNGLVLLLEYLGV